jgi:hypothetical protein
MSYASNLNSNLIGIQPKELTDNVNDHNLQSPCDMSMESIDDG